MTPAVVVIAYQRPDALSRLLRSVASAAYPDGVDVQLVITIDRGPEGMSSDVAQVAHEFAWAHGTKTVIEQPERLGLVEHFYACGRLTQEYGDVILLEDDLVVGPAYYEYTRQACEHYRDEERVAGFCLYGLWFNGFTHEPFLAVDDGTDVFFLKLPYTQGLAFTAGQWQRFEERPNPSRSLQHPQIHESFRRFSHDEWFPSMTSYLAVQERYFCFPRVSHIVGWGDAGAHFEARSDWFQTPLQLQPRTYNLPSFDEALAVYDSFFELLPSRLQALGADLPNEGVDIDLGATRPRTSLQHDLVLTTRPVRRVIKTYGLQMIPPELNVAQSVPGDLISLARKGDVRWDRLATLEAQRRMHAYYWSRNRPSRKRALLFELARRVELWRSRSKGSAPG